MAVVNSIRLVVKKTPIRQIAVSVSLPSSVGLSAETLQIQRTVRLRRTAMLTTLVNITVLRVAVVAVVRRITIKDEKSGGFTVAFDFFAIEIRRNGEYLYR